MYILLAVVQLQKYGMGVSFPPLLLMCRLSVMVDDREEDWAEISPSLPTNLYFKDIRAFMVDRPYAYEAQPSDYEGPDPKFDGGRGGDRSSSGAN